ncbi:MAG TPA: crotonase/enoyl-CoA hydratase family protein [Burkholderiaceae bacterium]|jgi:DSF synthase
MLAFADPAELARPFNPLMMNYRQLQIEYDPASRTVWSRMAPISRPCFNIDLLHELHSFSEALKLGRDTRSIDGDPQAIEFAILSSNTPGVFSLGGDLEIFQSRIRARDEEALRQYAHLCIRNIWRRLCHYDSNITTISLVQGYALGGGFEAALSADILIAERGSRFALPEILFNLFPGMGALSLLGRKIGMPKARAMLLSGESYSAEEMHDFGIVQVLAESGCGEAAVRQWISMNHKTRNGFSGIMRSEQCVSAITYQELIAIVDIWVESALKLGTRDLRMMNRLIRAQERMAQHTL